MVTSRNALNDPNIKSQSSVRYDTFIDHWGQEMHIEQLQKGYRNKTEEDERFSLTLYKFKYKWKGLSALYMHIYVKQSDGITKLLVN